MTQLYPEPIDKLVAHLCYLVCHYSRIHDLLTGEGSLGDCGRPVLPHLQRAGGRAWFPGPPRLPLAKRPRASRPFEPFGDGGGITNRILAGRLGLAVGCASHTRVRASDGPDQERT